ncbi:MAG: iron-sulfur cluster assembly scaffold protein [Pseudomonadota bacterium]|nr:iron-sulfur cluster assembly scaffold protein [Pseudomonadota bacterium]
MISLKSYSDEVLAHFHAPKCCGRFTEDAPEIGTGLVGIAASGDVVRLQVKVTDAVITDACFKAQGTCATIAVASWVTSYIIQKSVQECQALSCAEVLQALQLTPLRKHSVLLVLDALNAALNSLN